MNEQIHSGLGRSVAGWMIYCAALIDFSLFMIWFSVPIAAIRISGLTLAVILGAIMLLRRRLSLPYWRKTGSVATAFDAVVGASFLFTVAALLGIGKGLSPTTAFGILALVFCILMLFGAFFHRRDEKPLSLAAGILIFLGFGAFGIFLIYAHPSFTFTLDGAISGMIGGLIGGLVARLVDRHRLDRERNPEDPGSTAPPRRLIPPLVGWNLPPVHPRSGAM